MGTFGSKLYGESALAAFARRHASARKPLVSAELLAEAVPSVIESEPQYREVGERFGELVSRGKRRAADETRLMRLLGLLIEDYDRHHALPPDGAASRVD